MGVLVLGRRAPGFRRRGDPADRLRRDRPGHARCPPPEDVRRPVDRLGPARGHRTRPGRGGGGGHELAGRLPRPAPAHRAGRGDHPAGPPDGPAAPGRRRRPRRPGGPERLRPAAPVRGRRRRRRGAPAGRADERRSHPRRTAPAGRARPARAGVPAADAGRDPPGPARTAGRGPAPWPAHVHLLLRRRVRAVRAPALARTRAVGLRARPDRGDAVVDGRRLGAGALDRHPGASDGSSGPGSRRSSSGSPASPPSCRRRCRSRSASSPGRWPGSGWA